MTVLMGIFLTKSGIDSIEVYLISSLSKLFREKISGNSEIGLFLSSKEFTL